MEEPAKNTLERIKILDLQEFSYTVDGAATSMLW